MTAASVAFFSGDQSALELASYIATAKGEADNTGPFYESAKKLLAEEKYTEVLTQFASESKTLLGASEKDFEPLYNLLFALIKDAQPDIIPELVKKITEPIVSSGIEKAHLKLKVLSNLYNNLESKSSARYTVFVAIVNVAAQSDELEIITPHLASLDSWLAEWGTGADEKRALYLLISKKLEESGSADKECYQFLLKYLSTFDGASAEAKPYALQAIKSAIKIPGVLAFDDLSNLDTVKALAGSNHLEFLKIFSEGDLKQYQEFVKKNPKIVSELDLNEEDNLTKMRLLTLASLSATHVHSSVSYTTISTALSIPEDDVEIWVINTIRAGLVDAKMNQLDRSVVISRSVHRSFGEQEWKSLGQKLEAWKVELKEVLTVIGNAKLLAGSNGATVEAVIQQ
ncbi:uncharacterized protein EV422DRAFT_525436 [Fimicolochytrium jonesii]|uniref:uncharacterized protein n=1 Tax=Fimicolochytrium jonesii TaxID=1396493 RepID=UPI0022FF00A1|nr:uncharacterized protein EV422DRAFT_525436 [Fimicolochytrium jonesii]KAI8822033.1 hypothetical protein EV422DRAFT_525436 [Fimicolochytrium jonesii]